MSSTGNIVEKIERLLKAFSARPTLGHSISTSTTRLENGLVCVTEEGPWITRVDMPEVLGGTDSAPSPGVLGRAALGSCLTIGYAMWAARLDIHLDSIEVEVAASSDDSGMLALSDSSPGYLGVRYTVRIKSNAQHQEIVNLLDKADSSSPYLDVFTRDQQCVREVEISQVS